MDTQSELRTERAALVRADIDLREGEARVLRQEALVLEMAAKGQDRREAERLLELLRDTLAGWQKHRILIMDRIAYLELRSPSAYVLS